MLYPLFTVSPDVDIGHAHNEFLQAGLDLGIPGLIAFIALYIGVFWMLADIWKAAAPRSPLPAPRSPLPAPGSPLTEHCSLLTGHCSLLPHSLSHPRPGRRAAGPSALRSHRRGGVGRQAGGLVVDAFGVDRGVACTTGATDE